MVDRQKERVESAVTNLVDDIDKLYLRKMQVDMHKCAAKCCQDENASINYVRDCVNNCSDPLQRAQEYVQMELQEFHGRLQRCIMQCNDDIKMGIPVNPTERDIINYTSKFEKCSELCVDKHIKSIPHVKKSLEFNLNKTSTK